ncbi:YhjD/YihY/BrkB family envelope integrity protein [Streptomyces sp. NPDC059894]|uniref:YhjD/YihY/BrkB family envelope integrity protein n=1 Tax=unclassified Streptomyces TaxID=2593676 RepID=UPI00364A673B
MTGRSSPHGRRGDLLHRGVHWGEWRQDTVRRVQGSQAGTLWSRLSAVDFFGNSFQLAALALLCFFPFLIVVTAATGRDAATALVGWLGLHGQAAQAVASLFPQDQAPAGVTAASACLLVVGAVAVAGTLQSWYRRLFDVAPGGWRDVAARIGWLAALLLYSAAQALVGRTLGESGPVLQALAGFVAATCFWWGSMYVLLAGVVRWRTLLPSAVATALCWTGLGVFSALYFSAMIVENSQRYGPIGVVMVILSWVIAVGVVIHLGAVIGCLYLEHRTGRHRPQGAHR